MNARGVRSKSNAGAGRAQRTACEIAARDGIGERRRHYKSGERTPVLEIVERQPDVRRFPGRLELLLHGCRIGRLVLRLETPPQSEQRPSVARVLLEIPTEGALCLRRLIALQQRGAERRADRGVARRGLVV